jgi:hypothetical protein
MEDVAIPEVPPTMAVGDTNVSAPAPPTSPSQSHATSTPVASPAVQAQHPQPAKAPAVSAPTSTLPTAGTSTLPWPMPTVAANTSSPVIAATTVGQDQQQRTSYYRPRPNQVEPLSKPPSGAQHSTTAHQYIYQPNGSASSGPAENGK